MPNYICNKIPAPKYLIHCYTQVRFFIIINRNPDTAILGQQVAQQFQARVDQAQPGGMLQAVVVMLEGAAGVVGRVDVDAFDLPGVVGQQGFEGVQVVALDQQV